MNGKGKAAAAVGSVGVVGGGAVIASEEAREKAASVSPVGGDDGGSSSTTSSGSTSDGGGETAAEIAADPTVTESVGSFLTSPEGIVIVLAVCLVAVLVLSAQSDE